LRASVVRLEQCELPAVSDVALLKRLRGAEEWLRWMAEGVMRTWAGVDQESFAGLPEVRVLDATRVKEPGPSGAHWRVFYAVRLPSLGCAELHIVPVKQGESFHRFTIEPGTLAIADRGYAHPEGIASVRQAGADVLVRINLTNVPLLDAQGRPLPIIEHLRPLKTGQLADLAVSLAVGESVYPMRLCALRISAAAAAKAARRAKREASSKKRKVRPDTLEATHFVILLTSLPAPTVSAKRILALYRARWQIELAFKRLKSLMGLGHLKKTDPASARAWLHGKLLVAMLIQAIQTAARSFSPGISPGTGSIASLLNGANASSSRTWSTVRCCPGSPSLPAWVTGTPSPTACAKPHATAPPKSPPCVGTSCILVKLAPMPCTGRGAARDSQATRA
jgi:hypothetical protein